ncbi:MAG: ABC transporter permease [Acidobacteriaceae bacterium]|nr:ABC transporter permease [Acidobacteriaceae bacterium]
MNLMARLLRRSPIDAELEEELRSHIEHRAADLERSGLSRAAAERRARIEFGGRARFEEECREARGGQFLDSLVQDVRFALRLLRKSPGFTFVAVFTLALAIGANAVVFGVLNALILRPLSVPSPATLYGIQRGGFKSVAQSYPDYLDLRDRNRTFETLSAYQLSYAGLVTRTFTTSAWIEEVTGNYFDALHIQPYLGRFFHSSDERGPNSAPYIVLPYTYWHTHFQDDRSVVGRSVLLNKHPYTILGVAPPGFKGTLLFLYPDFWVPLIDQEQVEGVDTLRDRGARTLLMMFGHLKPGVAPAQAVADLDSIGASLEKTYPKDDSYMTFSLTHPDLAGDWFGSPLKAFMSGLMLLAGLILLAACANLGSLFAARAADRSREVALRLALGSSRRRILRQLLTEALLISVAGGAAGLWASVELLHALAAWAPLATAPTFHVPIDLDPKIYAVALFASLASGLLFGIVPVRQVMRADPYQIVKSGSLGRAGRRFTVRDLLLALQISICAVLVTSSLVAVRGLVRSLNSNFGFNPRGVLLLSTDLNMAGYRGEAVSAMQKRMIDTLQAIPGVTAVGAVDRPPLYYGANTSPVFTSDAVDLKSAHAAAEPAMYRVSPGYLPAAQIALLSGRNFTWHDDRSSPPVAIVNREFARKIFGSVPRALGASFKMPAGTRIQVIGVVDDGKYGTLTEDLRPAMFLPFSQQPSSQTTLVARMRTGPAAELSPESARAIQAKLHGLDPGVPFAAETWNQELDAAALFASRMATVTLGVLGAIGALLSVTGIFGMAAYSVAKRLKELGIRLALGAQRKEVLQSALGRAVRLLAFGSAAGLLLGIAASNVLSAIVYHATPKDPLVLAGVVFAMGLLGLLATWIPAQRALSIDPLILLRED